MLQWQYIRSIFVEFVERLVKVWYHEQANGIYYNFYISDPNGSSIFVRSRYVYIDHLVSVTTVGLKIHRNMCKMCKTAASQQRTLTPPDTRSCPIWDLYFFLMLRPYFPELVMSTDLLSLEHPSVLIFSFDAWVAIYKHKALQGMVKCMFLIPCVQRMFFKKCITYGKKNIRLTYGAWHMRWTFVLWRTLKACFTYGKRTLHFCCVPWITFGCYVHWRASLFTTLKNHKCLLSIILQGSLALLQQIFKEMGKYYILEHSNTAS